MIFTAMYIALAFLSEGFIRRCPLGGLLYIRD